MDCLIVRVRIEPANEEYVDVVHNGLEALHMFEHIMENYKIKGEEEVTYSGEMTILPSSKNHIFRPSQVEEMVHDFRNYYLVNKYGVRANCLVRNTDKATSDYGYIPHN